MAGTKITRLTLDGYGGRRTGSFADKTEGAPPVVEPPPPDNRGGRLVGRKKKLEPVRVIGRGRATIPTIIGTGRGTVRFVGTAAVGMGFASGGKVALRFRAHGRAPIDRTTSAGRAVVNNDAADIKALRRRLDDAEALGILDF